MVKSPFFLSLIACLILFGCQHSHKNTEPEGVPEIRSYSKPDDATSKIEGADVPYCLWYDPSKWMITYTPFYAENKDKKEWDWILILIEPEKRKTLGENTETRGSLALLYSDKEKKRSEEEIKKRVQDSLFKGRNLEEFEDLGSEERLVNGFKVFAWKFKTKLPDLGDRIFYNYYYTSDQGSVSLVTLTNLQDWKKNEKDVEELLNGFCMQKDKDKDKQKG